MRILFLIIQKASCVVGSVSTESEYRALANGATEIAWMQWLLSELKVHVPNVSIIWCDNIGASCLASNLVFQ